MKLYEKPAQKFPWLLKDVQFWLDGSHTPLRSKETALDRMKSLRADPDFIKIGEFYICQAPAPPRKDNKPFWIGRLLNYNEETAKV
jgi:hypothetical protein